MEVDAEEENARAPRAAGGRAARRAGAEAGDEDRGGRDDGDIVAIDHTDRVVTLKNENGEVEIGVGPEIKRFDELKVGDQITFRYQESLLVQIKKSAAATSAGVRPARHHARQRPAAERHDSLTQRRRP